MNYEQMKVEKSAEVGEFRALTSSIEGWMKKVIGLVGDWSEG